MRKEYLEGKKLFESECNADTADQLKSYKNNIENLMQTLEECLSIFKQLSTETSCCLTEVNDALELRTDKFQALEGSWADACSEIECREHVLNSIENRLETIHLDIPQIISPPQDTFKAVDIENVNLALPAVECLNDIKPSLYWNSGTDGSKQGIYICICNGFYVEVPYAALAASNSGTREKTVICKHELFEKCLAFRKANSAKFNTPIRECNYAHVGDNLIRVCISARCPNAPDFGRIDTLKTDLKRATTRELRTILMYSLSDLLLAALWHQHSTGHPDPLVLNDLAKV